MFNWGVLSVASLSTEELSQTSSLTFPETASELPFSIPAHLDLKHQVRLFKKRIIEQTLQANRYHQEKTALHLGIKPSNLSRLMKDLGLR